ncbi:hypothetical protein [Streptomyces sp. NPDC046685]|uniref:hypothetical protein n=1 Tax=Streptomyces sp. NPDC046685 TaxID=3157202 RepID=UPI0034051A16
MEELFTDAGPEARVVLPMLIDVAEPSPGTSLPVARAAIGTLGIAPVLGRAEENRRQTVGPLLTGV